VQPAALSQAGGSANEIDPALVLETVQSVLDDNKAEDITAFDLRERSSVSDHMVICSGRSTTHVGALAEFLRQDLKKLGADIVSITGTGQGDWICVDANAVVIHIFRPEVRAYYQLEKMWDPKFDVKASEQAKGAEASAA
jgi:ribosome-associated protein